ncbi:MAG: MFS transporter [Lachnospiraceae bacterium]|nr:MFS transporter [Lachnospiraceae bacterium]
MKRNLFFMYSISFFQGMVFYSSIATLYRQAAGISIFQITLIESISLVLSLAFEIPWGVLADRIGYRRTMIICNTLFFISKIIFWKSQSFADFLLERVLLAIVASGISGVDTSILYLSCSEDDSQRAFGIYGSLGTAGLLSSAAIYTVFIKENYRAAGFLTVISYGIAAILNFGLKEVKATGKDERTSFGHSLTILKETLYNKSLLLLIAGVALLYEVNQTITVFFNQLQYKKAGMSARLISGVYILMTLSGLVSVFSAPLTKKLKPRFFGAMLFAICSFACLMLAFTENPFISVLGVLLISICTSLMSPLGTELQNKAITATDRATALSMSTLIMDLLAVFTNLVFGKLAEFDLSAAMCLGGILCILGVCLYLSSLKRTDYR